MNKVMLKKVIERKKSELEMPVVYTGRIENSEWKPESLEERYKDIVKVETTDNEEPEATVGEFEFVGGNQNRLVYVRKDVMEMIAIGPQARY
jgi:hypothetical protein